MRVTIFLCITLASLTAALATEAERALATKGQALLTANCSRCHAVDRIGASPHDKAPPFRDVMKRYPAENMAEALAEGIVSGHPDMPEFIFKADEIDAIVVYLDGLNPPVAR